MKYLKTYKLFENLSPNLIQDIKDIFLELEDSKFRIQYDEISKVMNDSDVYDVYHPLESSEKFYSQLMSIVIDRYDGLTRRLFNLNEIIGVLERLEDYMKLQRHPIWGTGYKTDIFVPQFNRISNGESERYRTRVTLSDGVLKDADNNKIDFLTHCEIRIVSIRK